MTKTLIALKGKWPEIKAILAKFDSITLGELDQLLQTRPMNVITDKEAK